MRPALIVIDMQQGSFTAASPRHDTAGLVQRLNRLATAVRGAGGLVVFVQHDGPEGDPHHPDAPGWHLLADLEVRDGDVVVRKTACDSFLGTTLDRVLADNRIERLIVTGCATDYCVDTTVRSALARGIPTLVPSDGHTTADRPHLPAAKIIEHHNAVWADFIAPGGPATVCPCAEVPLT
ncbi:isochorismatase [Thalassobaculum fulvum]|uniref:Isochorismatase n=1 Tax=Thalassobaculum fulvum TaxID=1633335 RepID=A0A919CRJ4_9PROT|nr:cysteine hydrolase family protein [Thalassobaculum fulvum]GHD54173.1 isochorismatase [Thalassobaculum fulvum]